MGLTTKVNHVAGALIGHRMDELKQKSLVGSIGDVYSAQEAFHSKIATLIEAYQAECDRLRPPA